jgi:hypothetical protein
LSGIARQPELYAAILDEYRRAPVRRFPDAVFYEATSDAVIVYGVLQTARDPDKWRQRVQ